MLTILFSIYECLQIVFGLETFKKFFLELHQSFEVNTGEFEGNIRGDIIKKTLKMII